MYINKDALVAEIERQQRRCDILSQSNDVESRKTAAIQNGVYSYILSFLNTLEVKEVDLEEEICSFFSKNPIPYEHITDWPLLKNCAIYFFELGLRAQKGE